MQSKRRSDVPEPAAAGRAGLADFDRMQFTLDVAAPEFQETAQLRVIRRHVIGRADSGRVRRRVAVVRRVGRVGRRVVTRYVVDSVAAIKRRVAVAGEVGARRQGRSDRLFLAATLALVVLAVGLPVVVLIALLHELR